MKRAILAAALLVSACDEVCDGPACEAFVGECAGPVPRLGLEHRWSIRTDEAANPEIVAFIPGDPERAIATSRDAARVTELLYDEDRVRFGAGRTVALANSSSALTSVSPSPSGAYAAITVSDTADGDAACYPGALPGCACGSVLFVDLRPGSFGAPLGAIPVGYTPDGGGFSSDGRYFVTADEDDTAGLPCKPAARTGGSVSVIEIGAPAACQGEAIDVLGAAACRILQVATTGEGAEPEDAAVTAEGVVLATLQESGELARFSLGDGAIPPLTRIALGDPSGPDGIGLSPDGRRAAVALEDADAVAVVDIASGAMVAERAVTDDVPPEFNRDESEATRIHEPEQLVWFESEGAAFIAMTLQESHAVVAYRVEEDGSAVSLARDSIAPVGIDFASERGGTGESAIGPEGLAVQPRAGARSLFLTGNEREGSITLLRSTCPR